MTTNKTDTVWSVAQHDTISDADFWLRPLEAHTYLYAFLSAEGETYAPPYSSLRQAVTDIIAEEKARERPRKKPRSTIEDSRFRTWRSMFENNGILYVDASTNQIRLSPLGRALKSLYEGLNQAIEGANDHLARLAVGMLNRQLLRNPLDEGDYPSDSDLHPYRFVWRAMRQLDNKLHWEELNRVLMHVLYSRDEDAAIRHVREVRKATGGVYTSANVATLGDPAVDDGNETKRRITPWYTRAGFGGLLIKPADDPQGYRELVEKYIPLIDEALQKDVEVPAGATASREAYLRYLSDEALVSRTAPQPSDEPDIKRVLDAVERYGHSKVICLSGIPGTGKTHLAKLAAARLVDNDPYRFAEIQFHDNTSYDDFMEGFVPKPSGEGFELRPKTFRVINRRARLDPKGDLYVLLIEEFTRANVHAVLGELITYVEHRDRPFRLAVSQDDEYVARNLVILVTMNPRDKSALVLDQAILRRLHQIEVPPSAARLRSLLDGKLDPLVLDRLVAWFGKFEKVTPFGHAEFAHVRGEADLQELWRGTLRYFVTNVAGEVRESYVELVEEFPWR